MINEKVPLGKHVKVEGGFAFQSAKFSDNGIPIIRISNIIKGKINTSDCVKYPNYSFENFKRFEVKEGDILIAMSGATTGKVGVVSKIEGKAFLNQRLGNFKIKNEKDLLKKFLYRIVQSPEYQKQLKNIASGCAQPNISAKQLESIEVTIPPLPTQKKIVAILEKAEQLKGCRREADGLTDELLKSTFLEMFGDPEKNPMGWVGCEFKKIVREFRYGTSNKSTKEGYPVLRIPNIIHGMINLDDLKFCDVTDIEYRKLKLHKGDILFVRTNGNQDYVGRCAIVKKTHENFIYASYLIRAKVNEKIILPKYLIHYFNSGYGKKIIKTKTKTSAGQYNINTIGLGSLHILIPPLELQNKLAIIVHQVEQLQQQQTQSSQHIDDLFNVLMQQAFRGELS